MVQVWDQRLAGKETGESLVYLNYLLVFNRRLHSEFKNAMRSAFWELDKRLKKFLEKVPPVPAWRWIALLKVSDNPSCINSGRVRTPHSGGVRNMFLVPWPPFWTIRSPVPMSCSRKSLNGRILLLPRAAGTVIGRASCRERVSISVVAVSLKKKQRRDRKRRRARSALDCGYNPQLCDVAPN